MGGSNSTLTRYDEVWQSTDRGVTWTQATNATDPKFSPRPGNAAVVLGGPGAARLYVIGGYDSSSNNLDDVWQSGDGASWIHVNASAAARDKFPARSAHSAVAVDDTVYVIAGDQGGCCTKGCLDLRRQGCSLDSGRRECRVPRPPESCFGGPGWCPLRNRRLSQFHPVVQRCVEIHRRRGRLGERAQESLKVRPVFLHLKPVEVSDEGSEVDSLLTSAGDGAGAFGGHLKILQGLLGV